jgi:dihydroorotase/N-acyl-D-amino-acid deacylase
MRAMRLRFAVLVSLAGALAACLGATRAAPKGAAETPPVCDVIFEGGQVVDGSGRSGFATDVGVRGDRIVAIAPPGRLASTPATRRVDARGLVVAPGFIDILSQSGNPLLKGDGRALNKLTQGITTEILGEGWTAAPANERNGGDPRFIGDHGFDAWLRAMQEHHNATNVGAFVGATTLRLYGMGDAPGAPSEAELATMRDALRRAMQDGALGLGSALIYPPGSFATTEELVALAEVMAPYHGVYATHLRSEGDRLMEGIDEALEIGRRAGVGVEIFHIKAMGHRNWSQFPELVARIEAARARGQDVGGDTFPYTMSGTLLSALLPPWASADGKLLQNLADAPSRDRIHAELLDPASNFENLGQLATPEAVQIVEAPGEPNARWVGQSLASIAASMGVDWATAAIDLLLATKGEGSMLLTTMDEAGLRTRLKLPWISFGTDAGARSFSAEPASGHPRALGTYPRVLGKYVRDERLLSLEEAIRRMTSAVALRLSLRDRGVVRVGAYADLVVFDPRTIADQATYDRPLVRSLGVRHVFVNGVAALTDGEPTDARAGVALRGAGWTEGSEHPRER